MKQIDKARNFAQLGNLSIACAKHDSPAVQDYLFELYAEQLNHGEFDAIVHSLEKLHFLDSQKPQFRWFGAQWDQFVNLICPDIAQLQTPEQYQAFEEMHDRPHKNDPRWSSSLPVGAPSIRLLSRQSTLDDLAQVICSKKLDSEQFASILGRSDLDLAAYLLKTHWTPSYAELEQALEIFMEYNDCTPDSLIAKAQIEGLIFDDLARRDEVGQELDNALLDKDTAALLKLIDANPRLLTLRSAEQEHTLQPMIGESFLLVVFSEIPMQLEDGAPNPFFAALAKKLQTRYCANKGTGASNIGLTFAANRPNLMRFLIDECRTDNTQTTTEQLESKKQSIKQEKSVSLRKAKTRSTPAKVGKKNTQQQERELPKDGLTG